MRSSRLGSLAASTILFAAASAGPGCGSSGSGALDMADKAAVDLGSAPADLVVADLVVADFASAPPPNLPSPPQVVNLGGPVLATPRVQLIAYAVDPFVSDVEALLAEFSATGQWTTQTEEYGVGPYSVLPTILLPGAPPASLDDMNGMVPPFQATLVANVSGNSPAWGLEDGNVIYLFLLPLGTNIVAGGNCCSDFLGYHDEAPLQNGAGAPYAVVCHCAAQLHDPLTPLQNVTTTVTHELVETATDPFTQTRSAFGQTDDADAIWTFATGGEVADMCQYNSDANVVPPGAKYTIQRSWSNAAARAGKDPCVPAPSAPYFNSYAIYSDAITIDNNGSWATTGVKLAVGQSTTIPVLLWSPGGAAAGTWNVKARDLDEYLGGQATTLVTLDKPSGSSGDVLHLTLTVRAYDSQLHGAGFVLESTQGTQDNLTFGAVGM